MKKICMAFFATLVFFLMISLSIVVFATENVISDEDYCIILDLLERSGMKKYNTIELIEDFLGEERFVLLEGEKSYMIYDIYIHDYMECSLENNSIYYDMPREFQKIYIAPTYYYYRDADIIYDARTRKEIDDFKMQALLELALELKESMKEKVSHSKKLITKANRDVLGDFYFHNLITYFPINDNGSCGYVVMAMVLSYYDSLFNDSFIDEQYDMQYSREISSLSTMDLEDYVSSPGVSATNEYDSGFMHDFIYNICYYASNGYYQYKINNDDFGTTVDMLVAMLQYYFSANCMDLDVYVTGLYSLNPNMPQGIYNVLDYHDPVIVSIHRTVPELNHWVVAYAYDNFGVICHYGWHQPLYTATYINEFVIGDWLYVANNESHLHSDNYLWTHQTYNSSYYGTYCSCNYFTCNHYASHYSPYNNTYHSLVCNFCNSEISRQYHHFVYGDSYVCSVCNYATQSCSHVYEVISYSSTSHTLMCDLCSSTKNEAHTFVFRMGRYWCTKCSYNTQNPIVN